MNTLVREVFAVTATTPADELEALVNRLQNTRVSWGEAEEEAYLWAVEDMEKAEAEGNEAEYERLYWLLDILGDIRHAYFKAHEEEIVADYQPSEFEIVYAQLVFGDADPWVLM